MLLMFGGVGRSGRGACSHNPANTGSNPAGVFFFVRNSTPEAQKTDFMDVFCNKIERIRQSGYESVALGQGSAPPVFVTGPRHSAFTGKSTQDHTLTERMLCQLSYKEWRGFQYLCSADLIQ